MLSRYTKASFVRNFVFGVEDSLVSTVGLVSGIALAGVAGAQILLTGTVLVFVEAFSMAAGSYLSERTTEEYVAQGEVSAYGPVVGATIMFVSYLIAGVIPIAPYAYFEPGLAFSISVACSIVALLVLGAVGARFTKTSIAKRAAQMAAVGGIAIILGIAVGQLIP